MQAAWTGVGLVMPREEQTLCYVFFFVSGVGFCLVEWRRKGGAEREREGKVRERERERESRRRRSGLFCSFFQCLLKKKRNKIVPRQPV